MAQTARVTGQEFTAAEQADFDAMRVADDADDTAPPADTPVVEPVIDPAAADEASGAQQQQQRQQMVPHAALHEERERRKALDVTLAEERRQRTLLEERTNLILQRFTQPPAPTAPTSPVIPDLATDPVGHIVGKLQAQEAELAQYRTQGQQTQQQMNAVGQISALQQRAQALEAQFVVEHPDYAAAVGHLMSVRAKELEITGVRDPGQRAQMIQNEGLALAAQAMQQGQNPAELLYQLAGVRGYKVAEPAGEDTVAAEQQPAQGGNGAEQLQRLQAGQRQARSIGNVAGAAPTAWTAEKLLGMSDKDFAKALETHPEAMALMGS